MGPDTTGLPRLKRNLSRRAFRIPITYSYNRQKQKNATPALRLISRCARLLLPCSMDFPISQNYSIGTTQWQLTKIPDSLQRK